MPATIKYCSQTSQISAALIRVDTCDTRRFMNPHPGIWDEPATVPGYCHASPNGDNNDGSRPTANYSLLTANSLTFTFSAKERDSETGLSYFGSRYYSSDLSIWLSVDPMAHKYPSLSPYVYCANNPVKLVDPDGEDWFENELTGDVYYSKYLTKDDVSHIEGEGWKWMGKDDMFGSSPTQLILVDHFDKSTFVNCDQKGVETALFNGKNAKNFMSDMGYEFMPTKLEVAITKYQQMADVDLSGAPKYIYYQQTSEKALKSEYIPKTATASYSVLSRTKYVDKPLGFHVWKTTWTETRQYSYSTSDLMKYGNAMKQLLPKMMELYKDFESLHMESLIRRK